MLRSMLRGPLASVAVSCVVETALKQRAGKGSTEKGDREQQGYSLESRLDTEELEPGPLPAGGTTALRLARKSSRPRGGSSCFISPSATVSQAAGEDASWEWSGVDLQSRSCVQGPPPTLHPPINCGGCGG